MVIRRFSSNADEQGTTAPDTTIIGPQRDVTADTALSLADAGGLVRSTSAGVVSVTLPAGGALPFAGCETWIQASAAGAVRLVLDSGATLAHGSMGTIISAGEARRVEIVSNHPGSATGTQWKVSAA